MSSLTSQLRALRKECRVRIAALPPKPACLSRGPAILAPVSVSRSDILCRFTVYSYGKTGVEVGEYKDTTWLVKWKDLPLESVVSVLDVL